MSTTETRWGAGVNAEATEAWDGPLFDRFVRFRDIIVTGLAAHGDEALRLLPPRRGQRVLDIGCGFGDTTQRIAAIVGPEGRARRARRRPALHRSCADESAAAGVPNAEFRVEDVQTMALEESRSTAPSRGSGTMFFASPVAALRNVRRRARARRQARDGRLAAEARQRVGVPCAAGGRADRQPAGGARRADLRARALLDGRRRHDQRGAGAVGLRATSALRRCDLPILIGRDVEEAIDFVMALGSGGGDPAARRRPCRASARQGP